MHGDCEKNTEIGTLVVYLTVIVMLDSGVGTKANPNIQISFSEHRRQPRPTRRENVTLPFTYATVKQVRHLRSVFHYFSSSLSYQIVNERATRSPNPQPINHLQSSFYAERSSLRVRDLRMPVIPKIASRGNSNLALVYWYCSVFCSD